MTAAKDYLPECLLSSLTDSQRVRMHRGISGLVALRDGAFVNKASCKEYREDVLGTLDAALQSMWDRHMELRGNAGGAITELYYSHVSSAPQLSAWLKRATKTVSDENTPQRLRDEISLVIEWCAPISRDLLSKETLAKVQAGKDPAQVAARVQARRQAEAASGKTIMTCTCCWRGIAFDKRDGNLHHHGYQRPGHGSQTPSCLGIQYKPLEHAATGVQEILRLYIRDRDAISARLACRAEWTELTTMRAVPKPGRPRWDTERKLVTIHRGDPDWEQERDRVVWQCERELEALELEIAVRTAVRDAWKPGMNREDVAEIHSRVLAGRREPARAAHP